MHTFRTYSIILLTVITTASQARQYMFRDIFDQLEFELINSMQSVAQELPSFRNPSYELSETSEAFIVKFAVPGISKEDVEIVVDDTAEGALLTVKAEVKKEETEADDAKTYRKTSVSQQSFSQQIRLAQPVVVEAVQAGLEKGILTITLPKAAPVKKNSHSVKVT